MLRKKLKEQADSPSDIPEVVDHLARPFTLDEVQRYNVRVDELNSSLQPGEESLPHADANGLARTLMGALKPMTGPYSMIALPVVSILSEGLASASMATMMFLVR